MIDALKQEQFLAGSTFSDFLSGMDIQVATGTIPTITANTALTALDTIKAGSHVLSSGSRWVTFGTPFTDALYHVTTCQSVGTVAARTVIQTGSKTIGSFIAVGSPTSTEVFDWVAVRRSS